MSNRPMGVVVSILCTDDDPQRFSRRLVAMVNHGPMHVSHVVAAGLQIYPVRVDTLRGSATLLRVEFRMRNSGTPVGEADIRDLFQRIASLEVLDSHLFDANGVNLGPAIRLAEAG